MATVPEFRGEIESAEVRTPVAMMREQASLLGAKTRYAIEGKIETEIQEGEFYHSFNLVVPALDHFMYLLFRVHHGVSLYPVQAESPYKELKTEEEFSDWLRQRLSSPGTKKIVGNLLAQANS